MLDRRIAEAAALLVEAVSANNVEARVVAGVLATDFLVGYFSGDIGGRQAEIAFQRGGGPALDVERLGHHQR